MNFKPLGDRLLVERSEDASTTASGIIIPDNAKEKPSRGKVVAVGKEAEDVVVGDTIVFGKYSGNEISIEGKDYLIMELSDALGILS